MPHSSCVKFSFKLVVYDQKKEGASVSNSFALELQKGVFAALLANSGVTALAGLTAAFNAIRKGVQIGQHLEGVAKDLSRWGKACADFDLVEKQIRRPPWYRALGGGVEAQAMEIFEQRKQLAAQRKEMKDWICAILGPSSQEELLAIEANIRKQKREREWRRIELRQKIIEWVAGVFLSAICVGALMMLVLLMQSA